MTITTTQIRATIVAEAVQRALRECVCLLVYEYKDFFQHTVWAVLTKDERRPQESQLLCTINHEGRVDSITIQTAPTSNYVHACSFEDAVEQPPSTSK